jgi:hypothetical protein
MNSVPGAADLERKNQYWITYGSKRELARIIKLLENSDSACSAWAIALIKGETK